MCHLFVVWMLLRPLPGSAAAQSAMPGQDLAAHAMQVAALFSGMFGCIVSCFLIVMSRLGMHAMGDIPKLAVIA